MKIIIKANGKRLVGIFPSTSAAVLWAFEHLGGNVSARVA